MRVRSRGKLLLLVLAVSLVLWYATFRVLGLAGGIHPEPKLNPRPVPPPVQLAEPAWDRIDLQKAL